MKTHRSILFISIFTTIISLFIVIILSEGKIFNIALAFMGSAFIAFLLETPNYFSIKNDNQKKMYLNLLQLKINISILKNIVKLNLKDNYPIDAKIYENNIQVIDDICKHLSYFDEDFYFIKKKNQQILQILNNINNSNSNLKQTESRYKIAYYNKATENLKLHQVPTVCPQDINNMFENIIKACDSYINTINKSAIYIFNKKQFKQWNIDNIGIENNEKNFEISNI